MNKYTSRFELAATNIIGKKMRKVVKTLLKKLIKYTPIKTGHAVGDWRFHKGSPQGRDNETNDPHRSGISLAQSMAEIDSWDGIEPAYVVCYAKNKSAAYPDGYMYLMKVNAETAITGAGTRFIERAIDETRREVGGI